MRFGHFTVGFFADDKVMMTAARDLRQVGDTHHLRGFAELAQQFTHHRRRRTADADIHFIENQRRGVHFARGDHLNRQRNTRQFTA